VDGLLGAWKDDFLGIRSATEKFMDWVSPAVLYGFEQLTDAAKQIWNDFAAFLGGFWDGLKQTVIEPAAAFGKAIVEAIAAPFASFGKLLDRLPAGVKNAIAPLRDLAAALNPQQIALEIDAMGTAYRIEHPEYGQTPAGGGGGNKPRPHGGGGGGGDGSGGNWWDKKTEAQKEDESAQKRIAANARILEFLHKGESVDVAKLAGEYLHLSASRLQEVVASQKQVDSAVQAAESRKAYLKDLPKVEAEIRRLKAGHDAEAGGLDALKEKYPGLSGAMLAHMFQVQQYEKHLATLHEQQKKVNDAVRESGVRFMEATAATKAGQVAVQLYGAEFEKKHPGANAQTLWENLTGPQQQQAKGIALTNSAADRRGQLRGLTEENQGLKTGQRSQYAARLGFGQDLGQIADPNLVRQINQLGTQQDINERLKAGFEAFNAPLHTENQLIGTIGEQTQRLSEQFQALTGKSTLAKETMEKFGVVLKDLPKGTQLAVKGFFEMQKSLKFVQDFASGVEGVFQGMFSNLFQHGFKGFFSSVVQGFDQMLQKMAADYLSSELKNLVMNLLGPLLGSAFGGGGAAADVASAGLSGGAAATLTQAVPTFAAGGSYSGGPMLVGERGPELLFPHSSGTVMPHAQSMAMMGGHHTTNNITMNIQTQDAQSFQAPQNRHAITEGLARELQRAQARRR
jgi:hypothetical protein